MKKLIKYVVAVLLLTSIIVAASGCASASPAFLNDKVKEMIDLDVAQDTDGAYAMLYPGTTDKETHDATAKKIYEYFPVVEGYTCEVEQWKVSKGVGNGIAVYEGQYKVEFDGKLFIVLAAWRTDNEGSGFTRFQIINEDDWNAAQKNDQI